MFYGDIVPLDRDRHRAFRLDTSPNCFGIAAESHVVPALVQEFGVASTHLPIVFLPGAGLPVTVFLVGLRNGKSNYVGSNGEWRGNCAGIHRCTGRFEFFQFARALRWCDQLF